MAERAPFRAPFEVPSSRAGQASDRYGDASSSYGGGGAGSTAGAGGTKASKTGKLRNTIKTLRDRITAQEYENQHFKDRLQRVEQQNKLELARARQEVEYHKRLRQGADQRAYDFEDKLKQVQRQVNLSFDEAQNHLIQQSTILHQKNSELTTRINQLELELMQAKQNEELLKMHLECLADDKDHMELEREHLLGELATLRQQVQAAEGDAAEGEDGGADEEDGDELSGMVSGVDDPPGHGDSAGGSRVTPSASAGALDQQLGHGGSGAEPNGLPAALLEGLSLGDAPATESGEASEPAAS